MLSVRVVDLVHGDRTGIVIDGDVNRPANSRLDAGGSAAAAGKVVDNDLAAEVERHLGWYPESSQVAHAGNSRYSRPSSCAPGRKEPHPLK